MSASPVHWQFSYRLQSVHMISVCGADIRKDVLQKRTNSLSLKHHIVTYLRDTTRSFAYTREVLSTLKQQVDDEVKRLGGNRMLEDILRKLGVPEEEPTESR